MFLFISYYFAGLGEVSEALVNDENLTPEDFHDDQQVSPKISALQENNCHTSTEPTDCNEFKTPLNLRYGYKSADTPCLFSQDESASATPISSECFTPKALLSLSLYFLTTLF